MFVLRSSLACLGKQILFRPLSVALIMICDKAELLGYAWIGDVELRLDFEPSAATG